MWGPFFNWQLIFIIFPQLVNCNISNHVTFKPLSSYWGSKLFTRIQTDRLVLRLALVSAEKCSRAYQLSPESTLPHTSWATSGNHLTLWVYLLFCKMKKTTDIILLFWPCLYLTSPQIFCFLIHLFFSLILINFSIQIVLLKYF